MFKSIFKKGMENLRFAFNLDDYVPVHIMDELKNEQEFPNGDEDLENTDEFNFKVGQIFSKSKSKLKSINNNYNQKQKLFDDVIGYDDLKELIKKCLIVKDNCNVLYQARQHLLRPYS